MTQFFNEINQNIKFSKIFLQNLTQFFNYLKQLVIRTVKHIFEQQAHKLLYLKCFLDSKFRKYFVKLLGEILKTIMQSSLFTSLLLDVIYKSQY